MFSTIGAPQFNPVLQNKINFELNKAKIKHEK